MLAQVQDGFWLSLKQKMQHTLNSLSTFLNNLYAWTFLLLAVFMAYVYL
jgi:hypothetical protein